MKGQANSINLRVLLNCIAISIKYLYGSEFYLLWAKNIVEKLNLQSQGEKIHQTPVICYKKKKKSSPATKLKNLINDRLCIIINNALIHRWRKVRSRGPYPPKFSDKFSILPINLYITLIQKRY